MNLLGGEEGVFGWRLKFSFSLLAGPPAPSILPLIWFGCVARIKMWMATGESSDSSLRGCLTRRA
jgi:hypothetical protein